MWLRVTMHVKGKIHQTRLATSGILSVVFPMSRPIIMTIVGDGADHRHRYCHQRYCIVSEEGIASDITDTMITCAYTSHCVFANM